MEMGLGWSCRVLDYMYQQGQVGPSDLKKRIKKKDKIFVIINFFLKKNTKKRTKEMLKQETPDKMAQCPYSKK